VISHVNVELKTNVLEISIIRVNEKIIIIEKQEY
jgi:hypothetical protein